MTDDGAGSRKKKGAPESGKRRKKGRGADPGDAEKRRRRAKTSAIACWIFGLAGMGISFADGGKQSGLVLLLLGGAAGAAFLYLPVQEEKQRKEKRLRALQADYAGMVTRLGLYMTAGLSLRSSWERTVRDHREDVEAGGPEKLVYEEMEITRRQIMGGVFEDRAYADFGRRCAAPEYLRLGSLLETYVQQGNRELFQALEQEAMNALSGDLLRVKRRGEQAGTLLLIPILMLFALTLVLVVAPALMQMQMT